MPGIYLFGAVFLIKPGKVDLRLGAECSGVHFAIMAENAVKGLDTEVPAASLALELVEKSHGLQVVLKWRQAMFHAEFGQKGFSVMTEGWMADIMPEGYCLDQVFVQVEEAANSAGNARNQLHMQYPVGDVVVFNQAEYLGFVYVPGICLGVQNTVGIKGELLAISLSVFLLSACGG